MSGANALLAAKDFEGVLGEDSTVEVIGTSAVEVLGNDPERVFTLLINLSVNSIYLGFNEQVGADNGILLSANGGLMILNSKEDYTLVGRAIYGLASGASSNLYVLRMRREAILKVEA